MDLKRKHEIYGKFKSAFSTLTEQSVEYIVAKTDLKIEELDQFVLDNLIFEYSEDKKKVRRRSELHFKIFKMCAEKECELSIKDIRETLEVIIGEIPYLRFSNKIGHLVLDPKSSEKILKEIFKVKVSDIELTLGELSLGEKKEFSRNHGSHLEGILRSRYGKGSRFKVKGLLSHKRGIYLGFKKFRSISDLKVIFNKLIKVAKIGETIAEPESTYLKELLNYHRKGEEKLKDLDHFELGFHPDFKTTKCFFAVKKDGTKQDFSYHKCVKEISSMIK